MTLNRGEIVGKVTIEKKNTSIVYIDSTTLDNDRLDSLFYHNEYIENIQKLIKSGLPIEKLDNTIETINAPIGWQGIPSDSYMNSGEGVPLLRIKNINELLLDEESLIGVQEEIYNAQPAIQAQANDIIITRVGTIGRVCRIPERISKIAMGQNLTRIKLKETMLESGFMLAYMSSKFCQLQMQRYAYGGVQASLTNKNIKNLLVPIPSPEIQKYIGDKVRKAEQLREEAKRLKKEAEEIIYKYIGKFEVNVSKQYSVQYISEQNIYERIDSEYYNCKYIVIENYLNSKGYKLVRLGEVCKNIQNGKTYGVGNYKTKYLNIGVGELGDWFVEASENKYITEDVNEKLILNPNTIVWGNSAHLAKYIGEKVNIIMESGKFIPTTEVTAIEPDEKRINPYYLFLFMNSKWGYYQIQRTVKGMTAHSYPQDIENIVVPLINFSDEEKDKFKTYVFKSYFNSKHSKQLIQEAKKDVEDLIEGNFDMSKIR